MSTELSRLLYAILGGAILLMVLTTGCMETPSGPAETTVQTTATTMAPTTPAPTTPRPTATTTLATTPVTTVPVTETTVAIPPVAITIQNYAFSPASVTIPVGTTVTWTNQDRVSHTIVNEGTSKFVIGQKFKSNSLGNGETYSFTFDEAGTYPYYCSLHPSMRGTITVK